MNRMEEVYKAAIEERFQQYRALIKNVNWDNCWPVYAGCNLCVLTRQITLNAISGCIEGKCPFARCLSADAGSFAMRYKLTMAVDDYKNALGANIHSVFYEHLIIKYAKARLKFLVAQCRKNGWAVRSNYTIRYKGDG